MIINNVYYNNVYYNNVYYNKHDIVPSPQTRGTKLFDTVYIRAAMTKQEV